jgi:hypothetical protein
MLILLAIILALAILLLTGLLLWLGARYLGKIKGASIGWCFVANLMGLVAGTCVSFIPYVGWIGAIALYSSIVSSMLKTSFLRSALASPPTIIAVVAFAFLADHARDEWRLHQCSWSLTHVGQAVLTYQQNHDGVPPPSIGFLLKNKMLDGPGFCLYSNRKDSFHFHMAQRGTEPDTIIGADRIPHPDGKRTVLRADGSVELLTSRQFDQEMALPRNAAFANSLRQAATAPATWPPFSDPDSTQPSGESP